MKKTNDIITRYEHGEYFVDIIDTTAGETEAWISRKNIATCIFMFGAEKDQTPREEFLDIVEENLEDYIILYEDDIAED